MMTSYKFHILFIKKTENKNKIDNERNENMNENIFKRVEEKYLITQCDWKKIFQKIGKNLKKDKYYESTICNIYFDSPHDDLIIHSIDKPVYKEKVRLRSYGIPTKNDNVFLEMKVKYQDLVMKRRVELKLKDFYCYMKTGKYSNSQIMREIDYLFQYYKLKPFYYLAYDRKSYMGLENEELRITIDSNLRSRREDLRLELGDKGNKYFQDNMLIMEIKTLNSMPLWLVKTLSEFKIYPISFSKIGSIYKKEEGYYVN